jgi:NAD(P)-dependent dehydrogenase (short-subunit alcohol dehydrogenase family)
MRTIEGRVAVVTGAASGIGRAIAEVLAEGGMKVVLGDVEADALQGTTHALRESGFEVHSVVVDVSKPEQVEALARATIDRYGAVHVLCNNAGVVAGGSPTWRSSLDDWHWLLGVNMMGVVHGVRTFLPIMIEQDDEAHIVNTASIAGLIWGDGALYTASKFAVVGMSESWYLELVRGGHKPRMSVLCPGLVDTNLLQSRRNRPLHLSEVSPRPTGPKAQAAFERMQAMFKRSINPRLVAEQVLQAIRDERFYIQTHPRFAPMIEHRMKTILAGENPSPLTPTRDGQ